MISCLNDWIGLLDVTTPGSGKYLNRLPGIDTRQLDTIRDAETYNIEDAWDDIQNTAIDEFEQRLQMWASKYYDRYSYIENAVSGQYEKNTSVPQGSNYVGWLFDGGFSFYKNMKLIIPYVDLYTVNAVGSSIRIYNAVTGDLLDTVSFSSQANTINRITINKEYPTWKYPKIFVAYDDSEVQTIIASDLGFNNQINFAEKTVAKSLSVVDTNLDGVGSQGQGLIITYNIQCSLDNFICQRIQLFTTPFMYLLAHHFCLERLYSDKISHYTLLNKPRAEELSQHYLDRFEEMIQSTLEGLDAWDWDYCFRCDRDVTYRILMP